MGIGSAIGGLGSLGGGLIGMFGGSSAGKAQTEAAKYAANIGLNEFLLNRGDQAPFVKAGQWAVGQEQNKISNFDPSAWQKSPGYQFRLNEGMNQLNQSAAAQGKLLSGGTLRAAQEYGQNYATNDYQNYLNRFYQSLTPYQSLAGQGQTATTAMGQTGAQLANQMQTAAYAAGQGRASGYINSANALSGGLSSGINNMYSTNTLTNALSNLFSGGGTGGNFTDTGLSNYANTFGAWNPSTAQYYSGD